MIFCEYAMPAHWNDERQFISEKPVVPPSWAPGRVWDRMYHDQNGCIQWETSYGMYDGDGRIGWLARGPERYVIIWEDTVDSP